jgi:type II secretory pathway component PulF
MRLAKTAADGQSLAGAMQRERVFPPNFALGFATAEATGTLDEETAAQTRQCMETATIAMDVLAEWLPRVLYLAALAYGAWQVFELAGGIGAQYQRALNGF